VTPILQLFFFFADNPAEPEYRTIGGTTNEILLFNLVLYCITSDYSNNSLRRYIHHHHHHLQIANSRISKLN
jgi:hypothetical protein